jgi:GGDEF domain-containing protein
MAGTGAILFRLMRKLKIMQERLMRMAHYDLVTGLPNRQYLIDHLEARLAADDKSPFALFFTDLDNFKTVNDRAGHDAGDALLKRIGEYLGAALDDPGASPGASRVFRPSAGRLNVTARIGGDEFVLLVPGIESREAAAALAQAILDRFRRTLIDEHIGKYDVGLSIGAALFPAQSEDYHVILKYADIAMYHAKHAGKNDYRVYEDEMPQKREK